MLLFKKFPGEHAPDPASMYVPMTHDTPLAYIGSPLKVASDAYAQQPGGPASTGNERPQWQPLDL